MALARVKTWSAGEVLLATDLNSEFNNVLNNARNLISPLTASLDMDGFELIMDGDADSSLTADTDDRLDVRLGGVDLFRFDGQTASCVNGIDFVGTITGTRPRLVPTGDSNIGITIRAKGTAAGATTVIEDGNGNEILIADIATASAVNEVTITNAATGNRPRIAASGETNVGLALRPKGTGSGASVVIEDGNGNEVLIGDVATASAVNEVTVTNAATGNPPRIRASGETNVGLQLEPKGTGKIRITDGTDTTKVVSIDASGLTTATVRTITVSDKSFTIGKNQTRQVLTSGSGATYTTPTGCTRINVRMVGGGGGGGAVSANNGTAGNDTTFSTLTAGGGGAGLTAGDAGGAGGTASGGDINIPGGGGGGGGTSGTAGVAHPGGAGGNSYFGGGGKGVVNATGGNGSTNSGGGGGGGGGGSATNSGGGGGSGGYVEKLITSPAATYTYTVGAAANGGAAGGAAGGNGAAGIIIVDEWYD